MKKFQTTSFIEHAKKIDARLKKEGKNTPVDLEKEVKKVLPKAQKKK
jgi:hypothetical protein